MISLDQVEAQLKAVDCNFRFWGRPEIKELCNILTEGEVIAQCVNGRYENGSALLCATNHRLLLVDKKPMFFTLEDIRYDMIAELDFSAPALSSTISIMTPGRKLVFSSWNSNRLRKVLTFTQQRVTDIRQHYIERQFEPTVKSIDRPVHHAMPLIGNLALVGGNRKIPLNPYIATPLLLRRRRVPKFY